MLTAPSSWTCAAGWTLAGSTCSQIRTLGAELVCAAGWALNGTDCDRTLRADVVYFCPPAWTLHDVDSCRITFAASLIKSLEIDEALKRITVVSFDTEIDIADFRLIAYRNGSDHALTPLESSVSAGETTRSYRYADLAAGFWSLRIDMRSSEDHEASYVHDAALYVPDIESPQIDIATPQTGVIESFEQIAVTLSDNLDPAPQVLEIRLINELEERRHLAQLGPDRLQRVRAESAVESRLRHAVHPLCRARESEGLQRQ